MLEAAKGGMNAYYYESIQVCNELTRKRAGFLAAHIYEHEGLRQSSS
jgi:hypothetical protein